MCTSFGARHGRVRCPLSPTMRASSRKPQPRSMVAGPNHPSAHAGFTLIELMISLVVVGLIMLALMSVLFGSSRSKTSTANSLESTQAARAVLDMIARDLRSAGFGVDRDWAALPQPPIAYIDSM